MVVFLRPGELPGGPQRVSSVRRGLAPRPPDANCPLRCVMPQRGVTGTDDPPFPEAPASRVCDYPHDGARRQERIPLTGDRQGPCGVARSRGTWVGPPCAHPPFPPLHPWAAKCNPSNGELHMPARYPRNSGFVPWTRHIPGPAPPTSLGQLHRSGPSLVWSGWAAGAMTSHGSPFAHLPHPLPCTILLFRPRTNIAPRPSLRISSSLRCRVDEFWSTNVPLHSTQRTCPPGRVPELPRRCRTGCRTGRDICSGNAPHTRRCERPSASRTDIAQRSRHRRLPARCGSPRPMVYHAHSRQQWQC